MTSVSSLIARSELRFAPEGLKQRFVSFLETFKTPEAVSMIIAENNRIRASSRHWQL